MKTKINLGWAGVVALMVFVVVILTGWVMNVIELFHATGIDGETILRGIGVFVVPLGGVMGYL